MSKPSGSYPLRQLDACFIKREIHIEPYRVVTAEARQRRPLGPYDDGDFAEVIGPREYWPSVDTLGQADGIRFLCPKCFHALGGEVGCHTVICWFVGKVPDEAEPKPGRWNPNGSGLDDLTFVGPGAASIQLTGGCQWHGYVKQGRATLS